MQPDQIKLELDEGLRVSGLFMKPNNAKAMFVFAHGAGAGMTHTFMEDVAQGLAVRGTATLRFNFPFMEARAGQRWGRPDTAAIAHAAVRAALIEAQKLTPDLPLFAGGKSYGARMTSQMQGQDAFPCVRGLIFLGFPLQRNLQLRAPNIFRALASPCCSSRARATPWRKFRFSGRLARR